MIKVANLSRFFILLALIFSMTSCDDEEADSSTTITSAAVADAELTSLVAALQKADLATTLEGDGPFTVFAPTNDAFDAFLTANGYASLEEVPTGLLTSVLLNHVVAGRNMSSSLSSGYVKTLSASTADPNNNIDMYVDVSNGVMLNGGARVTTADLSVDNGVIHKVDAVIGLPTVVTHAVANAEFANLVSALTVEGNSVNYVEILSGTGPFTVFAPVNAAFNSFVVEKGFAGLGDIPITTLNSVLQYHVLNEMNVNSSAITDGIEPTTLQGTAFTINTIGGVTITDNEDRVSNVIITDVQADNGIIHVVDKVLSPL